MRKTMIILSLFTVIAIFVGVAVGCTPEKDGPNLTYTVTNMKQLSVLMGKENYYPIDSDKLTAIDLGNPSKLPQELKYAELLNKVTLVYKYPDAEYCRLIINKKCEDYVFLKDDTDFTISQVDGRELRVSNGYVERDSKTYFVNCEALINGVSYCYMINFKGDDSAEEFSQKADAALAWIKSEIENYKVYGD